jgi:predicted NodU family carbamoyl transferase
MIILGLNCFHGDRQQRLFVMAHSWHWQRRSVFVASSTGRGFRRQAIRYCLEEAAISLADVDHVAVNQDSRANLVGKLRYVLSQRPDPALLWSRGRIRRARLSTTSLLQSVSNGGFKAPVHGLEHHAAHLSSAFHVSPLWTVSGRLQTVSQLTNPLYYSVIDTFRELTGVPMVSAETSPVLRGNRSAARSGIPSLAGFAPVRSMNRAGVHRE